MSKNTKNLFQDFVIIAFSVLIAVVLVKTHVIENILVLAQGLEFLGSFIAGMFFTSVFTTAPAIVALGEIAREGSLLQTAFFGACGALLGDLVIFRFMRDRFSNHLMELLKHQTGARRVRALFKMRMFRWGTFFIGGLIIASPLPDELGISLLGFSKMRSLIFVPVSLCFNFLGILVIGLVARAF